MREHDMWAYVLVLEEAIIMGSQEMAQRLRRMIRGSRMGWQRVALLCVMVLAGFGASASSLFLTGVPQAKASSNAIQVENSYPGDPTWDDFSANLDPKALSGYGSRISVNHGQSIDFYVTTTAASVQIDIYRTGWYGGTGARHMLALGTFPGQQQAIPNPDPITGIVVCNWQKTASLTVPSTWTTGVYLAKLTGSSGDKSFIFFVVRNDGGHEDFLFQTSVTTYQAYNTYGGTSLYNNNTNGSIYPYAHATKVSFDRPFNPGDSNGAGHYLWYEYPMVRWAEKNGFDMTYTTDVDTDLNTNPLTNHKAFFSVGHDEYWSKNMRDNVEAAIGAGVNVGFFGANICYWQIRLEPNAAGTPDRVEVGYKDFSTINQAPGPDPQYGVNNAIVTNYFREVPVNRPENGLIGVMYIDQNKSVERPYVVTNASNWIFANTGFVNGTSVNGIVGYEYDAVFNNGATPANITILSSSPVDGNNGISNANSTVYTASSGARVFASGTIEWSWGLDNFGGRIYANAGIQQATANIFYNFNGGTPPPPPPPPPAGTYLQDNFESGNLTQWTGPMGTGAAGIATGAIVHNGAYSAQLTTPTGSSQYVTLTKNLVNSPGANTYTRLYFRVTSGTATSTLASATDSSGNNMWTAVYDGGLQGLDIYFWNGARTRFDFYSAQGSVQANTWYGLEINMNEVSSGKAEIWLDGTSIGTVTGNLSATNTISTLELWNDAGGTTNYFDDVIVSNAYNGTVAAGGMPTRFTPTSLTYGNQGVGTTSAPQSVTFTNTSTTTIHVTSVDVTDVNLSDFAISANTCTGAAIAPSATCSVSATFTPSALGTRTAALSFTDDAPTSPQSVPLSGNGVTNGPAASISPAALAFSNQAIGSTSGALGLTVTNNGTTGLTITSVALGGANPGDFTISSDSCTGTTVAVNGTCGVSVKFAPTATGTRSATLTFTDNAANSPQTVAISGTGVTSSPITAFNPTSLNFGNEALGSTSGALSITVTNTGTASLSVTSVALTGANAGDFAITADSCTGATVAVNATCSVSVTFKPTATGTRTASLTFTDNAGNSPQNVALSGNGMQSLPPNTYLQEDFESGNLSQWSAPAGTGSATVENTVVNNGSYALAMTNSTGQYVIISQNLPGGAQAHTFTRLYFRIANAAATATMMTATDSSGNNLWAVVYDAGSHGLDVYFWNGARARFDFYTPTNVIQANTWYSLEIELNESTNGQGNVWLNGTPLGGVTGNLSATNTVSRLYLWNDAASTIYYDDILVSNQYNGPLSSTSAVGFTPTTLDFGNQGVGTASAAKTVTVKNTGTASLHVSTVSVTGTNASDFAISADACSGATMSPGATCTVSVKFTPGATGSRSASLSVADDAPTSPQTVALTGNGVTPQVSFNPATLDFGNQTALVTSAAKTVTVTNSGQASLHISAITVTGTNAGDFAISGDTCTGVAVAVNGTCTVSVKFTPAVNGSRSASLSFSDDAPNSPQTAALTGTGTNPAPAVSANPTSVSFGNQLTGTTSAVKSVTITNSGTADLHVTMVAVAGTNSTDFTITSDSCTGATVAPSATCSVSLTFKPGGAGSRTGALTLTDDAADSPQSIPLSGTGTAPAISFNPTTLTFGNQGVGTTSAAKTVTVTNNGTASLHVTSATLTGANAGDFAISADSCTGATVAVNATCSVSVTFRPTATGTRLATLSFSDDAPASPQTVAISGSAIQAGIYLQDGFESGNLGLWSAPDGTGSATVENTVVNRGSYALAMTNGAGQYIITSQNLTGGAQAHTFTRLYFRITNASASATMAAATDSSGNNLWAVVYDAGSHGLDVYFWNGARARFDFYTPSNLIQANTWYALEIELNESATGQGNVWFNGNLLGGVTGDLSATNNLSRLYLWNDAANTTTYFDDIIVSNQYNGVLP